MKWYTALAMGLIACALAYYINMENEKRTSEVENLQKQITQLQEQVEESRKDTAINNEIVRKLVNEEW